MKVLVVGGSGFIGRQVVEALRQRGDDVVVTGRDQARLEKRFKGDVTCVQWDPMSGPPPSAALDGVDGVINLAGENVAQRWTKSRQERIRESRVAGTRNLVAGLTAAAAKPKVLVSASAIGYYGDTKHNAVHENAPPGDDFLAEVCVAWEAEARKAREAGLRTAIVRIGVVLGKGGGAYPLMTQALRLGVGGTIGLGKMWLSWVHMDDVVGILLHCLDRDDAEETYNATAPHPVSNWEFTKTFGKIKRRPTVLPVPPLVLYLRFGGFAKVVCGSQRVRPLRTLGIGYRFRYATIRSAIEALEGIRTAPPPEPPAAEPEQVESPG